MLNSSVYLLKKGLNVNVKKNIWTFVKVFFMSYYEDLSALSSVSSSGADCDSEIEGKTHRNKAKNIKLKNFKSMQQNWHEELAEKRLQRS